MKKIFFLSLLCCLSVASFAQTTVTLYSTGLAGSYTTGSATSGGTRSDGTIVSTTSGFFTSRGYAVFDLSAIPAGTTITNCVIGFNDSAYLGTGTPSGWATYGFAGDLSTVTVPATLYANMVAGTLLSNVSYGTAVGDRTIPATVATTNFIEVNTGNKVSICFTGGGSRIYAIMGETGAPATTSPPNHAPYLEITYTCAGVSGVAASVSSSPVCVGSSVTLGGNGTGTTSYSWTGPAGFTSTQQNPTFTTDASSAGVYTLTAFNSSGCGTEATTTLALSPTPVATVTASGPLVLCAAGTVTLTATGSLGDTYQWSESGTPISGETNDTYTATSEGSFEVTITGTNGCSATSTPTVIQVLTPNPPLSPSGSYALCVGSSVTLSIVPVGLPGVTYQWQSGGTSIPGATNTTYTTSNAGVYTNIIITPGCNDTSAATVVDVYALPTPTISYNMSTGRLSTSSAYGSYQWYLNTVAIPGATSYSLLPPDIGSYRVVVTDVHGCHNFSGPYVLNTLDVNQLTAPGVSVYPNPVTNALHIESTVSLRAVIMSVDGKKMMDQPAATDVDVSSLSQGLYIIMLYNDAGERIAIQKLVKE